MPPLHTCALPCRCRHPFTCVRVSRQSLHTNPFSHLYIKCTGHSGQDLRTRNHLGVHRPPTLSLSHSAPHHATTQLRLGPNNDYHLSSKYIYLPAGNTMLSIHVTLGLLCYPMWVLSQALKFAKLLNYIFIFQWQCYAFTFMWCKFQI